MKTFDFSARFRECGHTGLHYGYVYVFDQLVRKGVIDEIIRALAVRRLKALDFGCGSGDFLPVLGRRFKEVSGRDSCSETLAALGKEFTLKVGPYDLILVVSVLSFCSEIVGVLRDLHEKLGEGGRLVVLDVISSKSEYQWGLTRLQWREMFGMGGFEIENEVGMYNPLYIKQCVSWDLYRFYCQHVYGLERVRDYKMAVSKCTRVAKEIVKAGRDFIFPAGETDISVWVLRGQG